MEDYAGNSNKSKEPPKTKKKEVKQVVQGESLIKKKGPGQKFKDLFIAADIKNVLHYVLYDICVPAAQNMFVDSVSRGVERMTYGERAIRARGGAGPRVQYNTPPVRPGSVLMNSLSPGIPTRQPMLPSGRTARTDVNTNVVVTTKEYAQDILEQMRDIIDQYEVVSVADLNKMANVASSYVDERWGWNDISGAKILHIPEGYLLDLPPCEPIE